MARTLPPCRSARSTVSPAWILLLAACATEAHRAPPPAAGEAPPLERCAAAPAPGSRCAELVAALGGIAVGSRIRGGRVADVALTNGRAVVSLVADDGAVVGVDVVRLDPAAPPPPAQAGALGLYLRSDTPGAMTSAWQLALARAFADALPRDAAPPPWLGGLGDGPPRAP